MALKQDLIKQKLEEWASIKRKIVNANIAYQKELDPHIREHNKRTAPTIERHSRKVAPLEEKAAAIQAEIKNLLEANKDATGNPKLIVITTASASASVSASEGARVVSVQKFFDAVKTRNDQFYNCLKVVIKHAEKLIGKDKIDEISEKDTSFPITVSLNK